MATMNSRFVVVADREIHYTEWEAPKNVRAIFCPPGSPDKVLIMWHGLLRTGRDFDEAAKYLSERLGYRVLCPDTIGRGLSQWSPNPDAEYTVPFYCQLLLGFISAVGITEKDKLDFVGTSMGGMIGFGSAGTILKKRFRRLVLNDVGPELNPVAIERIKKYGNATVAFDRLSELKAFFREVYKPFGPMSEEWLERVTEVGYRRVDIPPLAEGETAAPGAPTPGKGKFAPHYDPAIMAQFLKPLPIPAEMLQAISWSTFDGMQVEEGVLVTRGANSDLLLPSGVDAMMEHAKKAGFSLTVVTVPGCGHAPTFVPAAQLAILEAFLSGAPVPGAVTSAEPTAAATHADPTAAAPSTGAA